MIWEIKEVGDCVLKDKGVTALTDDELVSIYTLLAYSSSGAHKVIADKLRIIVDIAKHSIYVHHSWENEGGAIVNGGDNGTSSSPTHGNT